MTLSLRGLAALVSAAALLISTAVNAQTPLATERDKVSYAIGTDVGKSFEPVGPDLDLAAFERALRHSFEGKEPLLPEAEAKTVDAALRASIAAREGRSTPGQAPGTTPPAAAKVDKVKVGHLTAGYMVGPRLLTIKDELDVGVLMRGMRDAMGGKLAMEEAQIRSTLEAFGARQQAVMQQRIARLGADNDAAGKAFLLKNSSVKGVFKTASGLQYMVLRQGSGARPRPSDRVRVHYKGTLLDGKTFDSSYDRGQPAEFGLDQVIAGWTEGVSLMPIGSKYRFWVPSNLGYGAKGAGQDIGPNATLVFEVELLEIL